LERIEKAKAQLKALGFGEDEIQRVGNQLRPRLSHKEKIEQIWTRLDLAPDGDIAAGMEINLAGSSQAHEGRALHQSFVVDGCVSVRLWQAPFEPSSVASLIAFRENTRLSCNGINQLACRCRIRGARLQASQRKSPGALPAGSGISSKQAWNGRDWLPPSGKRTLDAPSSQADGGPAGRRLVPAPVGPRPLSARYGQIIRRKRPG